MISFIMVKIGLLKVSDSKSISVLLVYLVLPCMIVNSFQIEYTPEVLKGLIFTVVAAVIAHIVFLILTAFLRKPLHLDMVEELTTVYTNGGILVVPLVKALLGTEYVIYSCSFLAVQMILIWTHGRHKMCSEERLSLKKIFWNANIVAICIGAFLFVTKIELPDVIGGTIDMLAEMIGRSVCYWQVWQFLKFHSKKYSWKKEIIWPFYSDCLSILLSYLLCSKC